MSLNAPLVLTADERESKLWRKLSDHFTERLASLRIQNDGDKSDIETAKLRGRISELKACIAFDKDLPEIE